MLVVFFDRTEPASSIPNPAFEKEGISMGICIHQRESKTCTCRKQMMAPVRRTNIWSMFSRRRATFVENTSTVIPELFAMRAAPEGSTILARVGLVSVPELE